MEFIHWYPGHIAKAKKKLKEKLNLSDVIIEVIDARLPLSSMYPDTARLTCSKPRIILLNKFDLADTEKTSVLAEIVKQQQKCPVMMTSANDNRDLSKILNKVTELGQEKIQQLVKKGMLPRAVRAMVIGMPNTGKSSIINKLVKKSKVKTGAKAGITREQQWVRINPKIELLDTPGIIPLKQENQQRAYKLAFAGSIGEHAYDTEAVCRIFIKTAEEFYPDLIRKYYNIDDAELSLESIALKRNWLIQGAEPDTKRCAQNILSDFRTGRLGRLTLDKYE